MREKAIEDKLVDVVKKNGGLCLKMTGYKGIPDRMILTPAGKVIFVEVKALDKELRPEQEAWQKKLRSMNFEAIKIDSVEAVNNIKDLLF